MQNVDKWANTLILFAGGLGATTGALGLAGWHLDVPTLYQLSPGLSPMQYNTALGMFASGLGFLFHSAGARKVSAVLAVLLVAGSALTLAEHLFDQKYWIDDLARFTLRSVQEVHPGRMSLNSAACFFFTGIVLSLAQPRLRFAHWHAFAGVCGAAVFTLGATALMGYLSGLEEAYDWSRSNRMAAGTAVGFVSLGVCALTLAGQHGGNPLYTRWVAFAASVSMFLVSLYIWSGLVEHERRGIQERSSEHARLIDEHIQDNLWHHLAACQRLASRLSSVGRFEEEVWRAESKRFLADFPVLKALALVSGDGRIFAAQPENAKTPKVVAALAAQHTEYQSPKRDGDSNLPYRFVPPVREVSPTLVGVAMPCEITQDISGSFFGVYDLEQMFRELQVQRQRDFAWAVYFENVPLCCFPQQIPADFLTNAYSYTRTMDLMGSEWELRLSPTRKYLALQRSPALGLVLYGGVLLALGIGTLVLLAQTASRRSMRLAAVNESLSHEISARTQAQRDLHELNEELEQRVALRTQQLEAVNKTLGEFTQIASHDLQEPLRKQQMFTGVLEESLGDNLEGDAATALDAIVSASRRMRVLVEDLLAYSRSGNRPLKLEKIQLQRCLDDAIEALAVRISETSAEIECGTMPEVWGDATLLTQIFQNLIGNALKFCRPDVTPRVQIGASREGEFHVIRVSDNGIGISPEFADFVFGAFKRLHTRSEFEGSGIGLSVCQNAITRMGGSIRVDSEPGAGSTFAFRLPADPPALEAPAAE